MKKEKEPTPTSVLICRYSFLILALGLYFGLNCYEAGFFAFLGYMFFTDWAGEVLFRF